MQVRPVRPAEYERAGQLIVSAYRGLAGGQLPEEYAAELADVERRASEAEVMVAVNDNHDLVGSVTFVPDASSPWAELLEGKEAGMRMLAVEPRAQGHGVGRALVEACIERGRALRRSALVLHTTPWMTTAQHLYEASGFERAPDRDWTPVPEVHLLAYRFALN